jgi:hypothetical protein
MPTKKREKVIGRAAVSNDETELAQQYVRRRDGLIVNPIFRDVFNENRKTWIRILIVADGNINFGEGKFGLSELINKALHPSAAPWENLIIVTAHRSANDESSDIPGFRFDTTPDPPYDRPFTIEFYDQVWLFGYERTGSEGAIVEGSAEFEALVNFMNDGGGVFATGDHLNLGGAMSSKLPRVRKMRRWEFRNTPGLNDATRIDTLREGIDPGYQFDDQSDHIPQEIYPNYKISNSCAPEPHHLLAFGRDAIKVLPDHMHEGVCVVPDDLTTTYESDGKTFQEFPAEPKTKERLAPEVVAVAVAPGGLFVNVGPVVRPPVTPRCYNVIVAYDGHLVELVVNGQAKRKGIGRVVVDASFHHFTNINLNGAESGNPQRKGFYDSCGNPTKDYVAIKQYYRNIVTWLCPPDVKFKYYKNLLLALRYMSPLDEEISPGDDFTLEDILYIGAVTYKAITERFSQAEAEECAWAAFCTLPKKRQRKVDEFINPWTQSLLSTGVLGQFLDFKVIPKLLLGSAMLGIAKELPESTPDVSRELRAKEKKGKRVQDFIATGVELGLIALGDTLLECSGALEKFSATLNPTVLNEAEGSDSGHVS